MKRTIAWGITGSGVYIKESVDIIHHLREKGYDITAFVSRAGETVLQMYGLKDRLEKVLTGDYPVGVVYESHQPPGYPVTGRLYLGVYDIVVISPATMNTVSKIVHGIADTLVSSLAMHAIKTGRRLIILPVDYIETKSTIPIVIDRNKCKDCIECSAVYSCLYGALVVDPHHKVRVYPEKCTRCYSCLSNCPYNAISFDVEIVVRPVKFYTTIIDKLKMIDGVIMALSPKELLDNIGAML